MATPKNDDAISGSIPEATVDTPAVRTAFSRRVRFLREERGFSQEGFAAASGLDRSYYGGIERGQRNVALDNIATIARTLDVPIRELFPSEEPPA